MLFYPGTPVFSINKSDRHNIIEILLKVALNTINQNYSASSLKQQSADRHFAALGHIILIPSQPVFPLSP
jgi:hypothetical protein